jgi:catechol-2,3-dioxygenase
MPALDRVLETALYVEDLGSAGRFYEEVLGLTALTSDTRLRAYDVGGKSVLLLFQRGGTLETVHLPGGTIPPHDGAGPIHLAFAVSDADLGAWEDRLAQEGVPIEGRTDWPRGGRSVYFRDPDGHLLELATPGIWRTY